MDDMTRLFDRTVHCDASGGRALPRQVRCHPFATVPRASGLRDFARLD
jgi:hypothetical protein